MGTGTRPALPTDFPTPTLTRGMTDPRAIEMMIDSLMCENVEGLGMDKCVVVGCPTMIAPPKNIDGFCRFHRRQRSGG